MNALRRGFTLVEILIVVMIIGILAAVAIPKFVNASQVARENALKDSLRILRLQIGVYRSQHMLNPGYVGTDASQTPAAASVVAQLVKFSDSLGSTSDTLSDVFKWGPYMNEVPRNPISGKSDFKILADGDPFTPDDTTGWLYQPSTGQIKANVTTSDSAGRPIVDY